MSCSGSTQALRQPANMLVVREQDNLGTPREVGKHPEGRGGAVVVELDEDIIDHQGNRLVAFEIHFQAGQAQGEVELIGRPLAQAFEAHNLASRCSDRLEHGLILVVVAQLSGPRRSQG